MYLFGALGQSSVILFDKVPTDFLRIGLLSCGRGCGGLRSRSSMVGCRRSGSCKLSWLAVLVGAIYAIDRSSLGRHFSEVVAQLRKQEVAG